MRDADSGLADIVDPVMPAVVQDGSWFWMAVTIAVSLLLILLLLWQKKGPAYLALRRLKKLKLHIEDGELAPAEAALLLALELRQGLGLTRLLPAEPPAGCKGHDSTRWTVCMGKLDELLYQHEPERGRESLIALYAEAEYWLRTCSVKKLKKIRN